MQYGNDEICYRTDTDELALSHSCNNYETITKFNNSNINNRTLSYTICFNDGYDPFNTSQFEFPINPQNHEYVSIFYDNGRARLSDQCRCWAIIVYSCLMVQSL